MEAQQPKARLQPQQYNTITLFVVIIGMLTVLITLLRFFYEVGVDWEESYYPAMHHLRTYTKHSDFVGFPNALFFLPHGFLPLEWGNAINMSLNLVVPLAVIWKFKGGWPAILLVYTSPMFFDLSRTNNVDWIPLVGVLLPVAWGLPFLIAKPQGIGGAALVWWKRHGFSPKVLIPSVVMIMIALLIWGVKMPLDGMRSINLSEVAWNFAPFPFFIPLGLYLLYKGYQSDDATIAAAASPFLVPYFAPYSLVPLQTLLACKHKKEALYVHLGFWIYFIVEARRIAAMD